MADARKIRDAGYYPFAESGNNLDQLTWISGWLTNYFYASLIKKFDLNHDGVLDKVEMAKAVLNGGYSFLDPRNKARLAELKRMSTYWQPGAVAADWTIAHKTFLTGRAGMIVTGSWDYETFKQDPQRSFPFGVFYFPGLDSRTSTMIPDGIRPTNKAAGYGSFQFVVTNTAVRRHTADVAMDFLKFATAPQNLSPMITEAGFALPAVKGAKANPDLAAFQESVAYPPAPYQEDDSMFDYEFAQKFLAVTSLYINEALSLDAASQKLEKYAQDAAHRVLGQ
jgi:ABC-type glycerol-3-phosphate transport system substrate-binding protein